MMLRLTEFSISSTDISTTIALRRVSTPTTPSTKSIALRARYQLRVISIRSSSACKGYGSLKRRTPPVSGEAALGQDDRTDRGHEQHNGDDLERHSILSESNEPHGPGCARFGGRRSDGYRGQQVKGSCNHIEKLSQYRGPKRKCGDTSSARETQLRQLAQVEQHDDEQEQHHDGARVDDNLDYADELGMERQVEPGDAEQVEDQPQGAHHRVL